jgi:hypothetical protein
MVGSIDSVELFDMIRNQRHQNIKREEASSTSLVSDQDGPSMALSPSLSSSSAHFH